MDYVFDFVFVERMGIAWESTASKAKWEMATGVKLSYSLSMNDENTISIYQTDYFKNYSNSLVPEIKDSFLQHQKHFDLFAAIFFLLARVEEYDNETFDKHHRYPSTLSELSKKKLLGSPVIDIWIEELRHLITTKYDFKGLLPRNYSALSTIDIDHFYAYKYKPLAVQVGATVRDLLYLRWGRLIDRLQQKDPYDTLIEIMELHRSLGVVPTCFVLTSNRTSFDKNLSPSHPQFVSKIKELENECEIGIHPSYYSNQNKSLTREASTLSGLTQKPITKSRHHFLRLSLPDTYASLIKNGITDDYTMGYPDQVGFRAGTSQSFYWYDLENDQQTKLRIHPFCVMDVTLKQYLKLNPEQAFQHVQQILVQLKALRGQFTIIWHNSSFYGREGWVGWKKLYQDILKEAFS